MKEESALLTSRFAISFGYFSFVKFRTCLCIESKLLIEENGVNAISLGEKYFCCLLEKCHASNIERTPSGMV